MSLPSLGEVEHADWPSLKRIASELGLNPKGRSDVVRLRVLDHVRRRVRAETWRAEPEHLAPLLTSLGFPETAARLWESTIRLDAPAPWIGLGTARLAGGELEEASKAFDRAAQMGDAAAHLLRAETRAAAGDFQGAVEACDSYLASRPGDLRGLALKAGFLARGGWADEAASVMRAAFESHPRAAELWRGLGRISLRAGHPDSAMEAYREALRSDPRDVDAWINRGTALLLARKLRDAVGAYREALEIDSSRAEALNNLGVAYLLEGRSRSAAVSFERAAKHLESPTVLQNVARALGGPRKKAGPRKAREPPSRPPQARRRRPPGRKRRGLTKERRPQRKGPPPKTARRRAAPKPRKAARRAPRRRSRKARSLRRPKRTRPRSSR